MRPRLRYITWTLFLAALVGSTAMVVAAPGPNQENRGRAPFALSGSVEPVYPLTDVLLPINVENPHNFSIVVQELVVLVSDVSASCPAEKLVVAPVSVPFQVPARGETIVTTKVRLATDAMAVCQGVTFPLAYSGFATKR